MSFLQTIRFINRHPLAQRHRIKALARFLQWQIWQKVRPHAVAYPFIGSTKLWASKGMTGATGNIYTGLHDFEDMGFLLHYLRAGDLFGDIGANIGSYTILAAGVTGASCIAVEPIPASFEILKKNLGINGIAHKVNAKNLGIGSHRSVLNFTKSLDTVNHVIPVEPNAGNDTISVACIPLNDLLQGESIPSLMKIDVEGFEQEVINGASDALMSDTMQALIIELNGSGGRYGYNEEGIHRQLLGYGFKPYRYDPFTRKLWPLQKHGHLNTIYIKDQLKAAARLETATPFHVFSEKI
jgi:FkbM family methyltransferase